MEEKKPGSKAEVKIEFRERRCSRIIREERCNTMDEQKTGKREGWILDKVEWEKCSRIKEIGEGNDSWDTVKEWRINDVVRIYRWMNQRWEGWGCIVGPNICDQFTICRNVACNVCFVALWIRIICIKLAWNWRNDEIWTIVIHAIGRMDFGIR